MPHSQPDLSAHPVGLSIVVPVYRGATTVGRLVEALSALQPAGGLEIVLVNDGSPDNSAEVCRAPNALLDLGVRKGDRVAIYLPMIPEAVVA